MATSPAPTPPDLAELLDQELAGLYQQMPELVSALKLSAGTDPDRPLAGQVPVLGYHLDPGEELFTAHLVTPTRFIRHQRSLANEVLTIAVPLARISRVATSTAMNGDTPVTTVTVEIDADVLTVRTEGEMRTFPLTDEDGKATNEAGSRTVELARASRAHYIIDGPNAARFASQLTGAI